ncbi:MAG: hypothetical protein R2708_23460 [Vicinamibacterales bacterium]
MQKILDDKKGVCGFVLDRVDVPGVVKRLIDRGFDVRVPTERVKAVALPVGVEPTLVVQGQPVALDIRLDDLAITERMIWLGAEVALSRANPVAGAPSGVAGGMTAGALHGKLTSRPLWSAAAAGGAGRHGEMSEWLKEHAWKAKRTTAIEASQSVSRHTRSAT